MTNDETRPLPVDGPAPARPEGTHVDAVNGSYPASPPPEPPSPWATTQPVVPASSSPSRPSGPSGYGPSPYGPPDFAPGSPGEPVPPLAASTWPDVEPDPWVDVTPYHPSGYHPSAAVDGFAAAPRPRSAGRGPRVLGMIGLVAAGAVAGALIVNTVGGGGGSDTAAVQPGVAAQNGAGADVPGADVPGGQGGVQGGVPGQGLQGGVQGGAPGQGLQGGPGQGGDGEQRVIGTLAAVSGSKVTVKTASGSATYQIVAQTQIVRNGALASAADLKVGDRVLVHAFPASGSDGVLERVIAVPGTGAAGTDDGGTDDGGADT